MEIADKTKVGVCVIIPDSASKEDRDAVSDILKILNGMYDIRDYDEVSSPQEMPDKVKGLVASGKALPFRESDADYIARIGKRSVRKWKKRH